MKAKRAAFVEAYLGVAAFNATKAAEMAGYGHPKQQGSRLLTFVDVKTEIDKQLAERAMSAGEVLERLGQMGRVDMDDFVNPETGEVDLMRAKGKTHLIKKFSVTHSKFGDTTTIELHDSQSALTLLGKHHKLFTDKVEHAGADGKEIVIRVVGGLTEDDV